MGLGHDRPDLIQRAAVDPAAVFHHIAAQHIRFELLQGRTQVRVPQLRFAQRRLDRLFRGCDGGGAFLLVE
jgi:hypothetical protein